MTHRASPVSRRRFLTGTLGGGGLAAIVAARRAPAIATSPAARPRLPYGVQTGDVAEDRATLWAACDRPARMHVELAGTPDFKSAHRFEGPAALAEGGFAAKLDLDDLPAGERLFYRVRFQDLQDLTTFSHPVEGSFRTPAADARDVSFLWSGDVSGQGWGINPEWGGMKIFRAMREEAPDFFIHSGDSIYADSPIEAEVELPDGRIWKNRTLEAKAKVAETLEEFRGNYRYNLTDEHLRAFAAEVPVLAQWSDHETLNNWYPGELLEDDRYAEKSVSLLAGRAKRAFLEWMPVRGGRIHRAFRRGPLLDVILLDMRSFRGPNSENRQPHESAETRFLGADQVRWLKRRLLESKATWKVIAADMPLGLVVHDGDAFENAANGDGPVLGREHEIADVLRFANRHDIANMVWLTGDVHYTAAHFYDPEKARFSDFKPFWEFVSGPLNAGTFGPNALDDTFGPQVVFRKAPSDGRHNLPPSDGLQFYGRVSIDGASRAMTVELKDLTGRTLFTQEIAPEQA